MKKFYKVNNEFDVKLIKEDLFVKVKPGLSSYAKEPEKVFFLFWVHN